METATSPCGQDLTGYRTSDSNRIAICDREFSELELAILLTVQYSDLFDYPLTAEQIHEYLCLVPATLSQIHQALNNLAPQILTRNESLVCWKGREAIFGLRSDREARSYRRLELAQRYAAWLKSAPFLRLVAVSGSQAAGNSREDSDLDIFIVTEPDRLWIVQLWATILRHIGGWRLGISICPNFYLTLASLELEERNLYLAREITQVQPLGGRAAYRDFLQANKWVTEFLPNLDLAAGVSATSELERSNLAARLEWILSGFLGDGLDRLIHFVLLAYYRLRLIRRGCSLREMRTWYSRRYQKVMRGGYGPVVLTRFRESVERRLGDRVPREWWDRLWKTAAAPPPMDAKFVTQMRDRYGASN